MKEIEKTTNQVKKKGPNPTGKGGFGENPQNRSDGRWKKEDSFTYNMNMFKAMTVLEFEKWQKGNPKNKRTMAQQMAFNRVHKAINNLADFKEVADRTEGKAQSSMDITSNGETMPSSIQVEFINGKKDEN